MVAAIHLRSVLTNLPNVSTNFGKYKGHNSRLLGAAVISYGPKTEFSTIGLQCGQNRLGPGLGRRIAGEVPPLILTGLSQIGDSQGSSDQGMQHGGGTEYFFDFSSASSTPRVALLRGIVPATCGITNRVN